LPYGDLKTEGPATYGSLFWSGPLFFSQDAKIGRLRCTHFWPIIVLQPPARVKSARYQVLPGDTEGSNPAP